ncbi:MAG TPA: NUDIX hydrolase [Bacillota bacterium]|nr:NUDIX hydrolase [Bacillota bacterium]
MARELVNKTVRIKDKDITFTYLATKNAVVILPLKEDGRVVMVRQIRPSVDEWLLELPAGGVEEGEELNSAARRELEEETGYKSGDLKLLAEFYPSPGITTEKMYLYQTVVREQSSQSLDDGEDIEVEEYSPEEAWKLVQSGEIRDGKTILGLSILLRAIQEESAGC